MGLSSGSTVTESLFHPGFQDVLEFVRQCSLTDPNQVCFPNIMVIEEKYIMTTVLDFVASLIYDNFGIINISTDCRIRGSFVCSLQSTRSEMFGSWICSHSSKCREQTTTWELKGHFCSV